MNGIEARERENEKASGARLVKLTLRKAGIAAEAKGFVIRLSFSNVR
jgi:hypothetical protein